MKKITKETSMRNWILGLGVFLVLAFVVPTVQNDMKDYVRTEGHELTYHIGPKPFVNVSLTVGRDDKTDLAVITRYGRSKIYVIAVVNGQLLVEGYEIAGDQAAHHWDSYTKIPEEDRQYIDYVRTKLMKYLQGKSFKGAAA